MPYVKTTRSVMVIRAENGIGEASSNISLFCCLYIRTNALGKRMNPSLSVPTVSQIADDTGLHRVGKMLNKMTDKELICR